MIFYITFNDYPSGIYSSQVIDVVKFIKNNLQLNVKLIAFISIRGFRINKSKIKTQLPTAIVVPMFPKLRYWYLNKLSLNFFCLIYKPRLIIGRSVFATQLAIMSNYCKVIYDGRGAIHAEYKEYNVANNVYLDAQIAELEKECVLKSNYRIAVSQALVNHWQREFNYSLSQHVIIPCTLNEAYINLDFNEGNIHIARKKLGFSYSDIVLVYSGSTAAWQTLNILEELAESYLRNENYKLIVLAKTNTDLQNLQNKFSKQIYVTELSPNEVPTYLIAADYGVLIREESITNQVASPVKFAEYLACGLSVLISNSLGDYSDFVVEHNVGAIFQKKLHLNGIAYSKKVQIRNVSLQHFQKLNFIESYKQICNQ